MGKSKSKFQVSPAPEPLHPLTEPNPLNRNDTFFQSTNLHKQFFARQVGNDISDIRHHSFSSDFSELILPTIQIEPLAPNLSPPSPQVNAFVTSEASEFGGTQASNIIAQRLNRNTLLMPKRADHRKQLVGEHEAPNAVVCARAKSTQERNQIKNSLSSHFLFKSLSEESVETVIDKMKHYALAPRDIVFLQGKVGQNFFVIATGHVEVLVARKRKAYLYKGQSFGEIALLHDSVRTATIRTMDRASLWGIERKDFKEALQTVNALKFNENKQFIDAVPLFNTLTFAQKDSLLSVTVTQDFSLGQVIVKEGEPGDLFYIIKEGAVRITIKNVEIREMRKGSFFGEQALVYNIMRTATITALGQVTVLSLGREDLVRVLGDQLMSIVFRNSQRMSLEKSRLLAAFTKNQMDKVIETMRIVKYLPGDRVISHGVAKGEKIWIILNGAIITSGFDKQFSAFESIGDDDLLNTRLIRYTEDYLATQETHVAEISKKEIEEIIEMPMSSLSERNQIIDLLREIQIFKSLPTVKLEKLVATLRERKFAQGEIVIEENAPGDEFFLVKEGAVDIYKENQLLRTLGKNAFFGERSILLNENRTASVKAKGKVVCWVVSREEFLRVIDLGMKKQLLKRMHLQNDELKLEDLKVQRTIGKGSFGTVYLVSTQNSYYALKVFPLNVIGEHDLYEAILSEKKILLGLDHPMIMKLVKTFKDAENVMFLEEYVPGRPFSEVIKALGVFSPQKIRFYVACILIILEHLHERHIVYRDLKPENIIIDEEGYPKLIDFDTAKVLLGRTYTVVGTPFFIAPEVIKGNGYGVSVDYWSLGVIMYELLYGVFPFGENEADPFRIYQCITEEELKVPSMHEVGSIVKQLLEKNPALRGDYVSIRKHK